MGKLALKIYKALYGLDIEAQSTELTRLRLENKRLSELLRSTSREYNALNDKYKKKKESLSNECGAVSEELNELKGKYEALVMEKENLENALKENSEKFKEETDRISLESEKKSGEIENLQKVIEGLNAEKDTLEKEKETLRMEKESLCKEKETLCKEKETLGTEKENLSKELKSLNELHKAEKENHNSEYELVADELKALKGKYEALVKEKEELEKSAKENSEKHKEETSKISFESEKMSGEIENLQKVIEGLNTEKTALIKEKENLCNENETLLQEKDVLSSEKESLSKEIKSANEAHTADKDKLNKEIDSLGKEIASLKELYQKEKEENTTLSEIVKTLESEIANLSLTAQTTEEVSSVVEEENEEIPAVETSIDKKSEKISDDEEEMKEMMQKEIISLTQKYDYIRVTTTIGNQYIYQSRHFQLRTGLFDWGIEGKEIITDEILYLENSAVAKMEGLDSPFDGEELICNMEDEDSASAVADSLLMAICTYQPIQVNYHDKNGRTTLKNLYHVTFKPLANKFSLPYKNLFRDMLDEKIDAEQLSALCPHNPEPRNFAIPQIQTLRRFNAFFTTKEGIETLKEGIKLAQDTDQTELAEVLMSKIQN